MKKLLPVFILFTFSGLVSSCDSDNSIETETVLPATQAEMSRTFSYAYNEPQSAEIASYSTWSVETYSSLEEERLNITFSGLPKLADTDVIHFNISKLQLLGNYIGSYALKSLPNPAAGAAQVRYTYRRDGNSSSIIESTFSTMDGHFTISSYDAKNKLISGSYEIRIKEAVDPKRYDIAEPLIRRCDITLRGSFANVKVLQ
ncbi:hypothetical protein ACFSRY_19400 [Pontibacter locisalis]|uniref:Uncharacterized protein n=1 Tax=Pontibacter locisalis TaxID=1719035 RepID=A0ABW5ISW7_9BACT